MSLNYGVYRADVVESLDPTHKLILIPKRYPDPTSLPVKAQSTIDAAVGDSVMVMDISNSHSPQWFIFTYESNVGRGSDSPGGAHTHPIGQIDGLVAALDAKVDDTQLSNYETVTQIAAKYATIGHTHTTAQITGLDTALSGKTDNTAFNLVKNDIDAATYLPTPNALIRRFDNGHIRVPDSPGTLDAVNAGHVDTYFVSKTSYNSGMSAKMDSASAWQPLSLGAGVINDTTQTGPEARARWTPLGLQLQSRRLRGPGTAPSRDQIFATVPASLIPPYDILFQMPVQRSGTGNPGASVTMKLKATTGAIQWVSDPTTNTSQGTGGGPADYITLNNILLAW